MHIYKSSEHPRQSGGGVSKRLGEIKGCKDKHSSWHLTGFPDYSSIESTVSCRGEIHRFTVYRLLVHLLHYYSPCRGTLKQRQKCMRNLGITQLLCYIGFGIGLDHYYCTKYYSPKYQHYYVTILFFTKQSTG